MLSPRTDSAALTNSYSLHIEEPLPHFGLQRAFQLQPVVALDITGQDNARSVLQAKASVLSHSVVLGVRPLNRCPHSSL